LALTQEQDHRLADGMRRAQEGDKAAYDGLLREVAALLRGYFGSRAESNESAEDLVQETLISIHRARHTYLTGRPFAPWMYAIARRRLADHWRTRSRVIPTDALDETLDWVDKPDRAEPEAADRMRETLSLLPENQRRVVELLKVSGLSIKETAKQLDISEAAVKVTAHRAYVKLRKNFENQANGHTRRDQ
jgi:RNA polymerase sigma-70 factor (ECF subfamily)